MTFIGVKMVPISPLYISSSRLAVYYSEKSTATSINHRRVHDDFKGVNKISRQFLQYLEKAPTKETCFAKRRDCDKTLHYNQ